MNALCFYSKYSSQCKNFVDQTKSLDLQFICVDNSIVRKKLESNSQFQIQYVPCILILYENGVVEKYEGEHAFRWAKNQLETTQPQQAPQPPQPSPPQGR